MSLSLRMGFTALARGALTSVDRLGQHQSVLTVLLMAALYAITPLDRKSPKTRK